MSHAPGVIRTHNLLIRIRENALRKWLSSRKIAAQDDISRHEKTVYSGGKWRY